MSKLQVLSFSLYGLTENSVICNKLFFETLFCHTQNHYNTTKDDKFVKPTLNSYQMFHDLIGTNYTLVTPCRNTGLRTTCCIDCIMLPLEFSLTDPQNIKCNFFVRKHYRRHLTNLKVLKQIQLK